MNGEAGEDPPIPVVVIGGYLGAGKTTLVNHVLRTGTGRRTLVLVNDFGALAIDEALIVPPAGADGGVVALANGCTCCGLAGPLIEALVGVREGRYGARPELLIVEASGVADPAQVAAHALIPGFTLDGVVVVADAETVRRRAADPLVGRTVARQLAAADVLLCNKADLVDDATRGDVVRWLEQRAPGARVVPVVHAAAPVAFVVSPATDSPGGDPAPVDPAPVSHEIGTGAHSVGHSGAEHDAWSWSSDELVTRAQVVAFVEGLPDGVVRAKGVLALADDPAHRTVFQLVGHRWELTRGTAWAADTPRSQLVVIGVPGSIGAEIGAAFASA